MISAIYFIAIAVMSFHQIVGEKASNKHNINNQNYEGTAVHHDFISMIEQIHRQDYDLKDVENHISALSYSYLTSRVRNKRTTATENAIYTDVQSCNSSQCQMAFTGATFLSKLNNRLNSSGTEAGIYLCNDKQIWFILSTEALCQCKIIYNHTESVSYFSIASHGFYLVNKNGSVSSLSNVTGSFVLSMDEAFVNTSSIIKDSVCSIVSPFATAPNVTIVNGSSLSLNASEILSMYLNSSVAQCSGLKTNVSTLNVFLLYQSMSEQTCLETLQCTEKILSTTTTSSIVNLKPNFNYSVQFALLQSFEDVIYQIISPAVNLTTSYNGTEIQCTDSIVEEPPELSINKTTSDSITLSWNAFPPGQVMQIVILWSLSSSNAEPRQESYPLPGTATEDTITDLQPDTGYIFRANVTYVCDFHAATKSLTVKTRRGPPSAPKSVNVMMQDSQSGDILEWSRPTLSENIINYSVQTRNRSAPDSPHNLIGKWRVAEVVRPLNAGNERWIIVNLTDKEWYEFRVYATNDIGRGDASHATAPYQYNIPVADSPLLWIFVAIGIAAVVIVAFICWLLYIRRQRNKKTFTKEQPDITTVHIPYGMDIELAHIRHMTNLAIAAGNQDGQLNLPSDYRDRLNLFPRDQLKLGQQLGSGAFGEVYRGVAVGIETGNDDAEISVAVKTLKETASSSEKCEFLMEAYFMSLFHHPNIISLLGVCLDNEPEFLILELMEGGDLLKYLRQARQTPLVPAKLKLLDLIDISLDLASGCQYLESEHFIHRDLAARNCLVSTKSYASNSRVVKIGDFGLARDLYRNDYYHKVGEGLLPIRWMALESITLKRYTVQSDVWAFGVVLWELLTFGQQPYPAYTNLEVIKFVQDGGRLEQPIGCPDIIYDLMKECWNFAVSERPTFQEVLETLQDLKDQLQSDNVDSVPYFTGNESISYSAISAANIEEPVFIEDSPNCFINQGFVSDEDDISKFPMVFDALDGKFNAVSPRRSNNHEVVKNNHVNYAQLGFQPSRETSVKSVIPRDSSIGEKRTYRGSDETIPMKTHNSEQKLSVASNNYVMYPLKMGHVQYPVVHPSDTISHEPSQYSPANERKPTAASRKKRHVKRQMNSKASYLDDSDSSPTFTLKNSSRSSYMNHRMKNLHSSLPENVITPHTQTSDISYV